MKKIFEIIFLCTSLLICMSSYSMKDPIKASDFSDFVRLNQLGFYPDQEKVAVVENGNILSFKILEQATGKVVLESKNMEKRRSPWSNKERTLLFFSEVQVPGDYVLEVDTVKVHFEVKNDVLKDLSKAAIKAFYFQRSGTPIEETWAGVWMRPSAHPDTLIKVHPNAASATRPAGTVISSPGGWYDAGDYNKYIVNSGFTVGLMQQVYQLSPNYFKKLSVNIPESDNAVPDLLDELYYNLSWMLTMQDPQDGGVYHKLTNPMFEGFVMPVECHQDRYVVQKSVTASLDFASVMAQASRLFVPYEASFPHFSEQALKAAQKAYQWAMQHPNAYYDQEKLNQQFEPKVMTGTYGDMDASDEFFWAASELYLTTGEDSYKKVVEQYMPKQYQPLNWRTVYGLGIFTWMFPPKKLNEEDRAIQEQLQTMLLAYCDPLVQEMDTSNFYSPYGNKKTDFFWGALADGCAAQAWSLLMAYRLTGKKAYIQCAHHNADYILGRNPLGYCYVTGIGLKSPMHIHHRISAADNVEKPIPGLLVGGPNAMIRYNDKNSNLVPDESYTDKVESYVTNEIAINWNALLLAVSASLDNFQGE